MSLLNAVDIAELIALAMEVRTDSFVVLLKLDALTVTSTLTLLSESSFVGWATLKENVWSVEIDEDMDVDDAVYWLETIVWAVASLVTDKEWLPAIDVSEALALILSLSLLDAILFSKTLKTVSDSKEDFVFSEESFDCNEDNTLFFFWIVLFSDIFLSRGPSSLRKYKSTSLWMELAFEKDDVISTDILN